MPITFLKYLTRQPKHTVLARFKLAVFSALLIALPQSSLAKAADANSNVSDTQQKLSNYQMALSKTGFNGALLVSKEGHVQWQHAFGYAEKTTKRENTLATVFDTGSVTKQFTAVAIMKLVDDGTLKTSQTIADFFENVPENKAAITLHQLLTHSSGFVGGIGGDFDFIETNQYFKQLFASPLRFAPGSEYNYSNAGYSVLARIIELTTKQSYESYLTNTFFKPLGMAHTGYLMPDWQSVPLSHGYQYGRFAKGAMASRYLQDGQIAWHLKGNGGIQSTIKDMHIWFNALFTGELVSKESLALITTRHVKEDPKGRSHYGYGFAIFTSQKGKKLIGHSGSNGVYYFDMLYHEADKTLVIMANNALVSGVPDIAWHTMKLMEDPSFTPKGLTLGAREQILSAVLDENLTYNTLEARFKDSFKSKRTLNRLGLTLLKEAKPHAAIPLFKLNIAIFPGDGNLHDSLGDAYLAVKDYALAKAEYKQALALAPKARCYWCNNANQQLARIAELEKAQPNL